MNGGLGVVGVIEVKDLKGRHVGRTAAILGNGPSLNSCDLTRLRGVITIGTNRSWKLLDADYHVVVNAVHVEEARKGDWTPRRLVTTCGHGVGSEETYQLGTIPWADTSRAWGPYIRPTPGFSTDLERGVYIGGIPLVSLQVTAYLGCSPIYLLGIDMRPGPNGEGHFYPGYHMYPQMHALQSWELAAVAPELKKLGVEVVNLNPTSALDVFPKRPFAEIFS